MTELSFPDPPLSDDVVRLRPCVDADASQRVAERCGFTREGVLRSFEERKGRRYDVVAFSLLPSDLR